MSNLLKRRKMLSQFMTPISFYCTIHDYTCILYLPFLVYRIYFMSWYNSLVSYCKRKLCFHSFIWTGEVISIPLPRTITSIWPLPFGLLLQSIEGNFPVHAPFPSSSHLLGARDIPRPRREIGHSPQNNYSLPSSFNHNIKGETVSMSSHLILRDLLEEPQVVFVFYSFCSSFKFSFFVTALFHVNVVSNLSCFCVALTPPPPTPLVLLFYFLISTLFYCYYFYFVELSVHIYWRKRKTEYNEGFWWKNNLDKWSNSFDGIIQ